jgi:ATP-dependent 26S proteasome regulatory subunit
MMQFYGECVILSSTTHIDSKLFNRAGRLDYHIEVPLPNEFEREEILRIHSSQVLLGDDVDLRTLASRTASWSGATLKLLIEEVGRIAHRRGTPDDISMDDFSSAIGKLVSKLRFKRSLR